MATSKIGPNALSTGGPYWDTSGNVGVGTSSPIFTAGNRGVLNVNGTSTALVSLSNGNSQSTAGYVYWDGTNLSVTNNNTTGSLIFQTNAATERARIDSSGNLLVGTTSRLFGLLATLQVAQGSNGQAAIFQTTGAGTAILFLNSATGGVGTITTTASSTAYNTTSDYRLKENVQPMAGALAKVAALKPVTYRWKADGSDGEGFIAHELQAVCPDAVTGEKDAVNEDGTPRYQGIDTSFLVATLTAAIQELKAELDTVKAELAALKGA